MKTTIEISDPLLREARKLAARDGVALRMLVEHGLHRVVAEAMRGVPFKLRRANFKGKGLRQRVDEAVADPRQTFRRAMSSKGCASITSGR